MASTYYPRVQNNDFKRPSDIWEYPAEEYLKDTGDRSYKLKEFERTNLDQIKLRINIAGKNELHEYLSYLDNFSYELKEILEMEKAEGISNIKLEHDLRKVAQLIGDIYAML